MFPCFLQLEHTYLLGWLFNCALLWCFTDTQAVEQYKEIYGRFYEKLVQVLPLTDAHFRAALVSKQMFHGDLLCQVDAKETNAEKNEHFLTNTIDCSMNIGIISPFITLLQVMETFGSTTLNKLAENIKTELMISTTGLTHDPLQSLIYTRG